MKTLALKSAFSLASICPAVQLTQKVSTHVDEATPLNFFDRYGSLWDGMDMPDVAFREPRQSHKLGQISLFEQPASNLGIMRMKVMGLENTGTNLAQALLTTNFKQAGFEVPGCANYFPQTQLLEAELKGQRKQGLKASARTICDDTHIAGSFVDKHSPPKGEYFQQVVADPNFVIIALMRNPFSWLQSLRDRPYTGENELCVKKPTYGGPGSTCNLALKADVQPAAGKNIVSFSSLAEEWNFLAHHWSRQKRQGNSTILLVSYEQMVLRPMLFVSRVFEAFGVTFNPTKFKSVDGPKGPATFMENLKDESNRDEAVKKIQTGSFLNLPGTMPDQVAALCAQLNKILLAEFDLLYACEGSGIPPKREQSSTVQTTPAMSAILSSSQLQVAEILRAIAVNPSVALGNKLQGMFPARNSNTAVGDGDVSDFDWGVSRLIEAIAKRDAPFAQGLALSLLRDDGLQASHEFEPGEKLEFDENGIVLEISDQAVAKGIQAGDQILSFQVVGEEEQVYAKETKAVLREINSEATRNYRVTFEVPERVA